MKKSELYIKLKYMNNSNYTDKSETYNKSILEDGINWLKEFIISFHNNTILPNNYIYMYSYNPYNYDKNKKYSKLVKILKTITELYKLINSEYTNQTFIMQQPSIYATNPEFGLDNYFYHPDRVLVVDYFKSIQLCNEFENMYYHIFNVLQELEFDLQIDNPLYN